MVCAYVRCSSESQNESRQVEALSKYNIEKWFEEKVSGKNMKDRKELQQMLDFCREGDTIYIMDFSRLARSTKDLLFIVETLEAKKVRLVSLKENLDTSTPTGKLMLTMIGAINEFERANILERQREGVAIAKRRGAFKGRKKKEYDKERFEYFYDLYMHRGKHEGKPVTVDLISKQIGLSRPTVYKLIGERTGKSDE
jgi:DNA invertase Pin-like site-specific DNA recombinase